MEEKALEGYKLLVEQYVKHLGRANSLEALNAMYYSLLAPLERKIKYGRKGKGVAIIKLAALQEAYKKVRVKF